MTCAKELKLGSILFSTQNDASLNIVKHLLDDWKWKKHNEKLYTFSACGKQDCCTGANAVGYEKDIIEIEPDFESNYFMYASTHKSEKELPALTAHFAGNWANADYGGTPKTLNVAYACKLKQILKFLYVQNGKLPIIFVEIGSSQKEWNNQTAGKIVAQAMFKSLLRVEPQYPTYIAFGGGHYTPKFSDYILGKKLIDSKEIAISHMCSKYRVNDIDEQIVLEAIEKTIEPVCGAIIDYKGLTSAQRDKIEHILTKNNIEVVHV
jgi:D-aminoacyl-tRNA deacylase